MANAHETATQTAEQLAAKAVRAATELARLLTEPDPQ